jgi:cell division protein FtsQ
MSKAVSQSRSKWRLAVAILAGLVLFVSTAIAARRVQSMLLADERFFLEPGNVSGVPGIRVQGNRYASRDRIALVFAPDVNRSIFSIPLAERRRRLLAIDWIEDASILRIWPNQLIVRVRERHPVAFAKLPVGVAGHFRYLLIDAQGVLLGVPRQRFDFPVLTGVTEDQEESERRARVAAMQQLLRELGGSAAAMVSEINSTTPNDMRVSANINGHNVELWLGDRNYLARFQNFSNHFDEIRRSSDGESVFDLRLDDRIMTVK